MTDPREKMTFREKVIVAALVVGILATFPIWLVLAPLIAEHDRRFDRAHRQRD